MMIVSGLSCSIPQPTHPPTSRCYIHPKMGYISSGFDDNSITSASDNDKDTNDNDDKDHLYAKNKKNSLVRG